MQAFLSAGFSLVIHLLFLTFILLSAYTFKNKKQEEVKVLLLEPRTKEVVTKALPSLPYSLDSTQNQEEKPLKEVIPKNDVPKQIAKKEKVLTKNEEEFLKRKIQALKQEKNKDKEQAFTEEELNYLQNRLAKLKREGEESSSQSTAGEKMGSQAEPSASTPSSSENLSTEFLLLVKRKLQANFELPIYLRAKSELKARVLIEVDSSGRILSYHFVQASGVSEFDRAVERCIRLSTPLPVDRATKIIVEFYGTGVGKVS
jgi:colicin import membrane protein